VSAARPLQNGFYDEEKWRYGLTSYAALVSRGHRRWIPYDWLVDLGKRIAPLLAHGGARIIVNAAPRHGKSLFMAQWVPTWYIEHCPTHSVILASYGGPFAGEWGGRVRDEAEMNPLVHINLRSDSKARENWQTDEGGGMRTTGVSGPITGRGGNLVIITDPHKDWEEAMSSLSRERVIDWFNNTLYTRLEPNASILVEHTRWHEDDLTGYLLNHHKDKWVHFRYPALSEGADDLLGRPEGEPLLPERFPVEVLENIKANASSYSWAGFYQQRPAPMLGGMVKKDYLKFYTDQPPVFDEWVQFWDLTFKATGTSYAVGQVWARLGSSCYLIDQVRAKMDFIEQMKALIELSQRWPLATTKCIEDAADAQAVKTTLQSSIPGLILVPAVGSKEARLAAVLHLFEAGNVYLPANAPWLDDYIFELTTFPSAATNDQTDTTAHALKRLMGSNNFKFDATGIRLPDIGLRSNPWEF